MIQMVKGPALLAGGLGQHTSSWNDLLLPMNERNASWPALDGDLGQHTSSWNDLLAPPWQKGSMWPALDGCGGCSRLGQDSTSPTVGLVTALLMVGLFGALGYAVGFDRGSRVAR